MARAQRRGKVSYRDRELERVTIQGCTEDYVLFRSYDAERGRLFSATEAGAAASWRPRWDTATVCSTPNPFWERQSRSKASIFAWWA
jgi:hypothetical protein